jgi:hypothetical protein
MHTLIGSTNLLISGAVITIAVSFTVMLFAAYITRTLITMLIAPSDPKWRDDDRSMQ